VDVEGPRSPTTYFEKLYLIDLSHAEFKKGTSVKDTETRNKLSPEKREELLGMLKARFQKNMNPP